MVRPRDELADQLEPGRFSPDYAAESTNRGAAEVLARQSATVASAPHTQPKVSAADANYTEDGTPPFVCGNCRYILYDKGAPAGDLCQLVEGPHEGGHIDPGDTCRLWLAKPAYGLAEGQSLPVGNGD